MSASDKKFFALTINTIISVFLLGAAVRALVTFLRQRPQLRAGDKVKVAPAPVNTRRAPGPTPVNGVGSPQA